MHCYDRDELTDTVIKDPFITKTRHTRFQAGCNIPLPAGESWSDKLKEKNIGADLQIEDHMNSYIAETYCAMAFLKSSGSEPQLIYAHTCVIYMPAS